MPKVKEKEIGFEESLGALEKIVAQLESGDLPLERALEIFEDGVGLARRCQSQLEEAERKVEVLLRERGEVKTVPFETRTDMLPVESSGNGGSGVLRFANFAATSTVAGQPVKTDEEANFDDDTIPF